MTNQQFEGINTLEQAAAKIGRSPNLIDQAMRALNLSFPLSEQDLEKIKNYIASLLHALSPHASSPHASSTSERVQREAEEINPRDQEDEDTPDLD